MDITTIMTTLAQFGIGAVLAGIVLVWKRQDDERNALTLRELLEQSGQREERLICVIQANTTAMQQLQAAVDRITTITGLREFIEERTRK